MQYSDCFHEICHLWVMVGDLRYESGRAYVVYDNSDEGMLTVEGYSAVYNNYEDLVKNTKFILAGVAGDKINGQFSVDQDIFETFTKDFSYSRDLTYFRKFYNTATQNHCVMLSAESWFSDIFAHVEEYLNSIDIEVLRGAASTLLEQGDFFLSTDMISRD